MGLVLPTNSASSPNVSNRQPNPSPTCQEAFGLRWFARRGKRASNSSSVIVIQSVIVVLLVSVPKLIP